MIPWRVLPLFTLVSLALSAAPSAACWLIAPARTEARLTGLKVFLSYDRAKRTETLIFQPEFETTAEEFLVLVATPTPEAFFGGPPDFFRSLSQFTQLKRRVHPESRLLPLDDRAPATPVGGGRRRPQPVRTLDEPLIEGSIGDGSLWRPEQMVGFATKMKNDGWSIDPKEIQPFADRKWFIIVIVVRPKDLGKDRQGWYRGGVMPFGLKLTTDKMILPLSFPPSSVADRLDLLCYIQADSKVDLPEQRSYQYQWVPFLQSVVGAWPRGVLPGKGHEWLKALQGEVPAIVKKGKELDFAFAPGQRPPPNKQGRVATTLEWARRLTDADIQLLKGTVPPSETVPDPDDGFNEADLRQPQRADAIRRVIRKRLETYHKERPDGYLVRDISAADADGLKKLTDYLKTNRFVTRLHLGLTRDEIKADLIFGPALWGKAADHSEYDERLQRRDD